MKMLTSPLFPNPWLLLWWLSSKWLKSPKFGVIVKSLLWQPPQLHPLIQKWSLLAPEKQDGDGRNAELKVPGVVVHGYVKFFIDLMVEPWK